MNTYTVFDTSNGKIYETGLSRSDAVGQLFDLVEDHESESELRRDDPGSDMMMLTVRRRPHRAAVDASFDKSGGIALSRFLKTLLEERKPYKVVSDNPRSIGAFRQIAKLIGAFVRTEESDGQITEIFFDPPSFVDTAFLDAQR